MNDNDVLEIICNALSEGLSDNGFASPFIAQSYQITHAGISSTPTWYIHKISTKKYGYPGKKLVFNSGDNNFTQTESRLIERTYQITTTKKELASATNQPTVFDMADVAAAVIESQKFGDTIRENNMSVYRVTDIREPYFVDESNENENSANFDFTIQYCRNLTSTVEPATVRGNVNEI